MICFTDESKARLRFVGLGAKLVDPDECIDCGACLPECPAEAIYHERDVPEAHAIDITRNAAFFKR